MIIKTIEIIPWRLKFPKVARGLDFYRLIGVAFGEKEETNMTIEVVFRIGDCSIFQLHFLLPKLIQFSYIKTKQNKNKLGANMLLIV